MIGRPNLLCRPSMITPCQLGIQKLHIHWKYPSGSGIYSHTVRHFPAASPSTAKRSTVESTLFTVTSSPGHVRDHHYDARLIHRILKSLLPQTNTFFIATASVVKDAADNPDCQGLREQWYYLWFYVRRMMPPTVGDETLAGLNLSARRTQSGGIPTDSMTCLCQLMFTTALKIAAGFPIHVGNRTR